MLMRLVILICAVFIASQAAAQELHELEGRWALMVDGRPLGILELQTDGQRGWTGEWVRVDRFGISESHEVFDISGPVVRRRILSATVGPERLELVVEDRSGSSPDRYFIRAIDRDHAEFGFIDPLAIPPLPLVRVGEQVTVQPEWPAGRAHLISASYPSNLEMAAIFEADQADRRGGASIDWSVVAPRDLARRERTLQLLDAGSLRSGDDFWHAAFVFQHGGDTRSYLLAHTFATIAAARGRSDARWIAAATLDRYLQSIGQQQVFGTQYLSRPGQPTTQEPYDRALIPDALRHAMGVPALSVQEERARAMDREREAATQAAPR